MAIILPDNKIRKLELTGDEIETIIENLEGSSYRVYRFMGLGEIIKKLRDARNTKGVKE